MSHLAYCHVGWVKRPLLRILALAAFVHPAQHSGPIKSMILLGSPLTRLNPTYIRLHGWRR